MMGEWAKRSWMRRTCARLLQARMLTADVMIECVIQSAQGRLVVRDERWAATLPTTRAASSKVNALFE